MGSLERLLLLKQQFQLPLIGIQEPMVDSKKLEKYKRWLGMHYGFNNFSNKIWIFWTNEVDVNIIQDKEQHILIRVTHLNDPIFFPNSGPCQMLRRLQEWVMGWHERYCWHYSRALGSHWGLQYNYFQGRKTRGRSHRIEDNLDFLGCLEDCGLQDAGYSGSIFTWCDNTDPPTTIWKRFDRLVYNSDWFDTFNSSSVTHLSRACSDHAPSPR